MWCFFIARDLYILQIVRHDELTQKRSRLTSYSFEESGKRGGIYSFFGNLLASDITYYKVSVYKPDLDRFSKKGGLIPKIRADFISDLHHILGTSKAKLLRRFESKSRQIVLSKEITVTLANLLKNRKYSELPNFKLLKKPEYLKVLHFTKSYRRFYPNNNFLSHVIGYLSFDGKPIPKGSREEPRSKARTGIEKVWDSELKEKKKGHTSYTKSSGGRVLGHYAVDRTEPENGSNVYLTIRSNIQLLIEKELKELVKNFKPRAAYVVMANPKNGAILGMAQYPSFNLNSRRGVTPAQMKNRMLLDYFDPGSTMKGVSIAGALDYGVVTLSQTYDCEESGYWYYGGKRLKDSHPHGLLSVAEIVEKSSNIGTAKIALDMGKARLYSTLRRFGFGQVTNVGIGLEGRGVLRSLPNWDKLSVTRFPMGQGISVTAMQMLQAYCTLANNGVMMQLHVVDRIENPNTGEVKVFQPELKRIVIEESAAKAITSALALVTKEHGTAKRAAIAGIDVAGKTGTSQKWDQALRAYSHRNYIASFIGYLPAENPEFVLMVVADEPQGSHYGGTVSAPTFKAIAEKTLNYIQSKPL